MKFVDEYRQPELCQKLVEQIRATVTQPWTLMEVCGGQTHGLLRYGIDGALEDVVRMIHGPGCPICVTPLEAIDRAIRLSLRPHVTLASFGDMLRVPGNSESLLQVRGRGGSVHIVYSPLDAVQFAEKNRERHVVFFAVGFETTVPATALAVRQAAALGLENFSLLVSHVRVQPAMEQLAASPDCIVDGFLAAGHVCTVAGFESYREFVAKYRMPVVVTGFEPVDLLTGILRCVEHLERREPVVVNSYGRSVTAVGNESAMAVVDDVYEVCDRSWRGLGTVPRGGLRLRSRWSAFDAEQRFTDQLIVINTPCECRSGEVLTGRIRPIDCEHFGNRCTPDSPLGAPMVSDEGACAAYHRYARGTDRHALTAK